MIALQSLLIVAAMVCFSYALSILCNKDNNEDRSGKTKGQSGKAFPPSRSKQFPYLHNKPKRKR